MSWLTDLFGTTASQQNANAASGQALGTSGMMTGQGMSLFGGINPTLQRFATGGAPGFGPTGLSQMLTGANLATAAKSGATAQQDKLNALRSGNPASINATADAANRGGSMAAGSTVQDILSKNAMLKQQQQQDALRQLGSEGSTMLGTGAEWGRQEAPDIKNQFDINQAPFEDLMKLVGAGTSVFGTMFPKGINPSSSVTGG
jgi:hypothetical protein